MFFLSVRLYRSSPYLASVYSVTFRMFRVSRRYDGVGIIVL